MIILPLPIILLCLKFSRVFGADSAANTTTLGADDSDPDHYHLRRSFRCPGIGNYAVRSAGNCAKFFECKKAGKRPVALKQCSDPDKNKFNRLSLTCEKAEYVKCKWCRKLGFHADLTSDKHFISCLPGIIASRFKCDKGTYDPVRRQCRKTKGALFDINDDAEIDPPTNIVDFMKAWIEKEKGDSGDSDEKVKKQKKGKDKDTSDEDKKKSKKKKQDSDEDEDKVQKGRGFFGSFLAEKMSSMFGGGAPTLMVPPSTVLNQDKKSSSSIELSDSSEERKRKDPPPKKGDGSDEKESDEKEKKKKKKKDKKKNSDEK